MRKGLLMIMFMGWLFGPPSVVQKAAEAYAGKHYAEAAAAYGSAQELYPDQHPVLNFNAGQSWYHLDSINKAKLWYGKVTNASKESPHMGSWAWNNIGCMFASDKAQGGAPGQAPGGMPAGMMQGMGQQAQGGDATAQLEQALQAFKDALKLDHDNGTARYNYELIKRKLQQQQQNQQQQNQDQKEQDQEEKKDDQKQQKGQDQQKDQPQNQENKQNQGKQGEGGEPQQMSPAEAERLLEAMNSNEKKFLQQIEKGKKHRTYNQDGPDW